MKGQSAVEIDLPRVPVNSAICVIIGVRHPYEAEESPLLNESFINVSIVQYQAILKPSLPVCLRR